MNSSNHTPTVEVKLLKDDEWKRIQQNTFTRWVNQHLKNAPGSPRVQNLATDFHDGILLIRLAEVLAHRNLARFNRKPIMRTQKLDNISTVLNFLQKEEHIKIVNIDSSHIADHNLKLILGLIWTLILHYSISQPIPSTESADDAEHPLPSPRKSGSSSTDQQQSPKQRLLAWIQEKVPHRRVANFTSDWSDGILLGALVDACLGADAFTEWRQWNDGSNAEHNTHRAMQAAEDGLGVAKLITPEELTNPNVDEKSVMTYLAQFPRAHPLLLGLISGLDHHAIQHVPCRFRVELERTTLRPSMDILDPCANLLLPGGTNNGGAGISMVRSVDDEEYGVNGNKAVCPIYNVQFTPTLLGEYQVTVYAQNVAEPLGPRLPIETALVTALPAPELVGLGDEAVQGERRRFNITNVNDASQLDVLFVDPSGREVILDAGSERDEQTVTCCYTPSTPGKHTLSVLYRKCHIPHSPFTLHVHSNESNNGFDAENSNELPPPPAMPKEEEMLRQQPLRNGTSPTNVTDVDEHPVVVLEEGDELHQMTPPPVDEDEAAAGGTTTMVTKVLKTTTSYTITQQNGTGVDHSTTDPLIVDMDLLQLRYRTNSESYGNGAQNTAADVVVQPIYRHEELQFAPLEMSEELEAVAAGPFHHHAFRPLCRERSPERIEAAAMVTVQGHGLEGFVPGQPAQFMADTSQTDSSVPKALFVGVITARGPAEEVTVQHVGDGRYNVFYKIQDDEDAIVFVKYGKNNVDGSPFSVRPMQPGGSSSYSSNGTVLHGDDNNYYRM